MIIIYNRQHVHLCSLDHYSRHRPMYKIRAKFVRSGIVEFAHNYWLKTHLHYTARRTM